MLPGTVAASIAAMRVLHVAEAFGGGVYEFVCNLAAAQIRDGHEVVVAYGVRPETPDEVGASVEGPEFIPLGWSSRAPAQQLLAGRRLRRLARQFEPDIVHLHSSFAGVVGAAVLSGRPVIYTPHAYASTMSEGGSLSAAVYRVAEGWASRRATVVGAVSEHEGSIARGYGAHRVEVVPNGIPELDGHGPTADPPARPRVIALGRTVPQRRPESSARILAAIADLADLAWIGGGGAERGAAGAAALEDAGIALTGWVDHDRVIEELARSTIYLHWTAWDGLPLSVLEAMACDRVVVASDIGPNREVLGPEQVCSSEEEAIDLLRRLLLDDKLRESFLASQRSRRTRYSLSRMLEGWAALYDDLVSRPRAASR